MLRNGFVVMAVAGLIAAVALTGTRAAPAKTGPLISHDVYFTLQERTPENRQKLVDGCHKYLTGHPGTVFYAAGPIAAEFDRPVNDREFDVALHVVFEDKAAHDRYQDAERHQQFIETCKGLWKTVRVFDSAVERK